MNYKQQKLEIVAGLSTKPAFATREEYETFRQEFARAVKPEMQANDMARARSEEAARYHWVHLNL